MKLPRGARVFPLKPNTKIPANAHGHLQAEPIEDAGLWTGITENYGLALDGQWVVVDFDADAPERAAWEEQCQGTWTQRTARTNCEGRHYLFALPEGFNGRNTVLRTPNGHRLADIKTNGYIVGPDSTIDGRAYEYLGGEVQPAPEWVLERIMAVKAPSGPVEGDGWDTIPDGARDNELFALGSYMRRRGLSEAGIRRALGSFVANGLIEQPEGREVEQSDIDRLARSAARYDMEPEVLIAPKGVSVVSDLDMVFPPTEWIEYGFVPKGQLTMMYGAGGLGKSTAGAYWVAEETKKGNNVLVLSVEESIQRFAFKAILMGADRSKICFVQSPHLLLLPRDAEELRGYIAEVNPSLVWIDAANSHIQQDTKGGGNAATCVRKALEPLSIMAQDYGPAIVGVFHENKLGEYLGSVEMINVARQVIHVRRLKRKPLSIEVKKTNLRPPSHRLLLSGESVEMTDPLTGQTQMEKIESGEIVPERIVIVTTKGRKDLNDREEDESAEDGEYVVIEQLAESVADQIKNHELTYPGANYKQICEDLGISKSTYYDYKSGKRN